MMKINECIFLMNKLGDIAQDHFTKDLIDSTIRHLKEYRKIKLKAEKKKAKKKAKKENANY